MKLKEIYDLAVAMGIKDDPRGKKGVEKVLSQTKEEFEKLSEDDKKFFDEEKLKNPYSDTRILCGGPNSKVTGVLAGIDMEVEEVLLADRLRQKGRNIDLLLAHHPEGKALAALSEVMVMQADIWAKHGVPINIGDVLIDKRMKEVFRTLLPVNHQRAIDTARLLDFAFLSVHTPSDNLVTRYLQKQIDGKDFYTLQDLQKFLRSIPEYEAATLENAGPTILVGSPNKRAGKIIVEMTGGTEPPEESIKELAQAGVGTLVGMHMSNKLRKKAEEHHLNVVIGGHTASDAIGMNLFLDEIEKKGIHITVCSGLKRISRN